MLDNAFILVEFLSYGTNCSAKTILLTEIRNDASVECGSHHILYHSTVSVSLLEWLVPGGMCQGQLLSGH